MVFMADMLVVLLSCVITFSFNPHPTEILHGWIFSSEAKTLLVTLVYATLCIALKTNQYIVRLSVIEDVYRIVLLIGSASMILVISSLLLSSFGDMVYFSVWNLFIIGVFSFSFMVITRLVIKYLYTSITAIDKERTRVIMLGTSINSVVLASALKIETEGRFKPVALLSLDHQRHENSLNGIPVETYSEAEIADIFAKYRCETLIFLASQIELMRSGLADAFLNNNIHLLMLNQIEEFDTNDDNQPKISTHVQNIRIEDLLGREPIRTEMSSIKNLIRNQVVMITGAAGSIGSEIVNQVATLGASEIVLVDQAETPMHDLQLQMEAAFPGATIHLYIGDVANPTRMELAFRAFRPRYVFHAAAYKHVPMMERNPCEAVLTNVFGTKIIADLSVKYNVEKFVMVSTDKAVNPTNVMGASKRIAEIYVQSLFYHLRKTVDGRTTQFITTRFGNVLGSNGSVIPLFRRQIAEGGPVTVTHKDIIRYFMTIPEACSLVLEAGCMGNGGEIYIFDMGKPVKIYDLARRMIKLAGMRPDVDIKIVETGLRPGEKLYEELLNDRETTIATRHKKIMIAKVRIYEYNDVMEHLKMLRKCIDDGSRQKLVEEMKHIVPEFKSNNSIFEQIDKRLKDQDASADQILHEAEISM
ncbi:MAG: polysaccharide biosynthesis protein [Muribaculaceae bacterium]|nr:polysaccharide biosynthesis protein [Muribaculaceae bacterium]